MGSTEAAIGRNEDGIDAEDPGVAANPSILTTNAMSVADVGIMLAIVADMDDPGEAGHVPEAAPTVIHGIIVLDHVLEVDPAHAEALALVHAIRTAPVQKGPLTGAPVKMVMEMVLLG